MGQGAERGLAVSELLLEGNVRYVGGSLPSSLELAEGVMATVLTLAPLPAEAHVLLGCAASSIFVVQSIPSGVEMLAVGNVEHGVMSLGTAGVIVLAAATEDLPLFVQAARDQLQAKDCPLPIAQLTVLERMMPALARTLAVASPRLKPAEVLSCAHAATCTYYTHNYNQAHASMRTYWTRCRWSSFA